jgi:excisionase family DNA binding protein
MDVSDIPASRLAYSLAEAETLSGLSKSTLYRIIGRGELATVKRGRRRLIPRPELEKLVRPGVA